MPNIEELIRLIDLARGERTQNEFALRCGFSSSTISKIKERGAPPQPYILQKIAKHAYNGVSYADLMQASGYIIDPHILHEPQIAFSGGTDDLTEDELAQVQDFIAFLKSKRK